ncbi:MAG: hypothetical protein J0L99_08135 [Chitinophagales bacterium]|nr:hypothetical protein [Chitinophagales bacterium]
MRWNSLIRLGILALLFLLVFNVPAMAQCAMCKASAEANLRAGGGDPRGLNNGILYMLSLPYLIVGFIGYMWWRKRRREQPGGVTSGMEFNEN